MDPFLLGLLVAIAAVLLTLIILGRRVASPSAGQPPPLPEAVATEDRALVGNAQLAAAKPPKPRDRMRARRAQEESEEDEPEPDEEDDSRGIGTKKKAKLAAKEAKRQARELQESDRDDRRQREAQRLDEAKQRQAQQEDQAKAEAEIERKKLEEEKKKEEEEYQAMKAMFSVVEDGTVADQIAEESQGLLGEFVDFIKEKKVVLVEELATRFQLKTKDAIMRLQALEEMGRVTGVMDDRGKFIYISEEEMKDIAKFVRQRGRVTIADLAENSHRLIRLQGIQPPSQPD